MMRRKWTLRLARLHSRWQAPEIAEDDQTTLTLNAPSKMAVKRYGGKMRRHCRTFKADILQ